MANETQITVVGNMVADPELRFTPNGAAVANFTIASTPRTFDRQTNEWKDGDTLFLRGSIWKEAAENVAGSLTKGMRVIAQGRLKQRSYEKDGQTRTVFEMDVDEIGPSLKYATAQVTRVERNGGGQQGGGYAAAPQGGGFGAPPAQGGGWGAPPPADWGAPQGGPPQHQGQPDQQGFSYPTGAPGAYGFTPQNP